MVDLVNSIECCVKKLISNYTEEQGNSRDYQQSNKKKLQKAHNYVVNSVCASFREQDLCRAAVYAILYHGKEEFENFLQFAAQFNVRILQYLSFLLNELNHGYIYGLFCGAQNNLVLSTCLCKKYEQLVQFIDQHQCSCFSAEQSQKACERFQNCLDCWMLLSKTGKKNYLKRNAERKFGSVFTGAIKGSRIATCFLGKGVVFVPHGNKNDFQYRLSTFASFPGSYYRHVDLANAGFYYNGEKHAVICHWCKSCVKDWAQGDDPRSRDWHITGCMMLAQGHHSVLVPSVPLSNSFSNLDESHQNPCLGSLLENVNASLVHPSIWQQQYENVSLPARLSNVGSSSMALSYESHPGSAISVETRDPYSYEKQYERSCIICAENRADVVFIPCGHLCCCIGCSFTLKECPTCQAKIARAVRSYVS